MSNSTTTTTRDYLAIQILAEIAAHGDDTTIFSKTVEGRYSDYRLLTIYRSAQSTRSQTDRLTIAPHGGDIEAGVEITGLTSRGVINYELTLGLGTPAAAIEGILRGLIEDLTSNAAATR